VRGRVRERAWVGGEGTGVGGQAKEGAGVGGRVRALVGEGAGVGG
jgi:hypothetical protein